MRRPLACDALMLARPAIAENSNAMAGHTAAFVRSRSKSFANLWKRVNLVNAPHRDPAAGAAQSHTWPRTVARRAARPHGLPPTS
jgi:hypothetical protein